MRVSSAILAVLASALAVSASNPHDNRALISGRHSRISTSSTQVKETTPTKAAATTKAATKAPAPTKVATSESIGGLLNVKSNCGNIGATKQTTRTTGPNGSIDWLNCGLTSGGWNPPHIKVSDIVSVSLSAAVGSGKGPFLACSKYVHYFEQYGGQYGIPAIMLAAFAMQESSCNPNTIGGAGEQGLMQITKDKCGGAPGGNCRDPAFNIRTGAKYFADTLNSNGGDLLAAVGNYNGWVKGMTYAQATAAAKTSCCRCQRNCDYLHQFFNGWLQNIDAYSDSFRLGKYFNLDVCN
ncbi:hypothetical protein DXG01_005054 [Tephrocybe rancida]|nr:hypothetical protein DXG01_005054 [Tephrocybe rancida]